jgi:putative phage-type endonuclease
MKVVECIQGSAQWLEARHGKITASRIADVMDVLKKGGEGASRRNYRMELAAERLSGRSEAHFVSPEMQWGSDMEPQARETYSFLTGSNVSQVGLVIHPTMDYAAASPDGLVGEDGCCEFKCPKTTTHIKWMLAGGVPEEHQLQCLWVMACTGRKWCDFSSFDPRLPAGLRMFVVRMERNEEAIQIAEDLVRSFNGEVEAMLSDLRKNIVEMPIEMALGRSTERLSLAPPVEDWAASFDSIIRGEVTP